MNHNITDKIKKILALAGNNPNKHETELAMIKAQEMLAKHHLKMKDLPDTEPEKVLEQEIDPDAKIASHWKKTLAAIVAMNFRCKCILNHGKHYNEHKKLSFIGEESDIEIAINIFHLLISYYIHSWGLYKIINKATKNIIVGTKNDYFKGFSVGIQETFKKNIAKSDCTSLMVITPQSVIKYTSKMNLRKGIKSKITTDYDTQAAKIGKIAGERFKWMKEINS